LATQRDSEPIAAWLAARRPAEVDEALLWRASQLGVELQASYEYTSDYARKWLKISQVGGTPETREAALAELRHFLTPAPQSEVEAWLAELSVIVARRADDEFTEELRLIAYCTRLSAFPADVVREALIVRTWRFWPAWAEIEEVCRELVSDRRRVLAAIEAETALEEQRALEQAQREQAWARHAAERARWEAEHAACLSDTGCEDCSFPDVCASIRRRRADEGLAC
jgi:hypothetical protein